jgi:UDP-N-acetylmuramate--alanine ligase
VVAVFQPHRYSRTAQFLEGFAAALSEADSVLIAPLYAAGEAPIPGISSAAVADAVRKRAPQLPVQVAGSLEELAAQLASASREGDLVLAMGAGDVNSLWDRLGQWQPGASGSTADADTALAA